MTDKFAAIERCTEYLANGGLWNPENVHPTDYVRDLVLQARAELAAAKARISALESHLQWALELIGQFRNADDIKQFAAAREALKL